jgi:hypothetical protein
VLTLCDEAERLSKANRAITAETQAAPANSHANSPVSRPKTDRTAYQRDLMRARRAKAKAERQV